MFTVRIHSVDTDHPLFLSPPFATTAGNPKLTERRGVVHLFRARSCRPAFSHPFTVATRSTLLFIVAVPNYFSSDDLLRFFGPQISDVSEVLVIRNDETEDRYSVLIRTASRASADAFYFHFNGERFSPAEVEICHVLFLLEAEFTESAEIARTSPVGYAELPTCPICLERLDQDTSGIINTLCGHSCQCSCVSKWTYLSCQVCRLCQQQDEKPTCSVCGTSESLWICVLCGFVGCGRYKEGHTIRHCLRTQHFYSLELGTQEVWDYVGENYVHRLNQSKVDGKSATTNSCSVSVDGGCGTSIHARVLGSTQGKKGSYVAWNGKMDEILISVLYEQIKEGNKGDGDWKPQAYQAVADKLRSQLDMSVTTEHVRNRTRVWKKHYSIVTDIQRYSKFIWDEEKKMVVITKDDLVEWEKYCQNNPLAAQYKNKTVDRWDDICALFGADRAVGDGAEQHDDAALVMDEEMTSEGESYFKGTTSSSSKKQIKDRLADAATSFANSFKEYVESKKTTSKPSGKEIYEVVSNVFGIQRLQILRAVKGFMNSPEEFQMLKDLPEDEQLDWILLCLAD